MAEPQSNTAAPGKSDAAFRTISEVSATLDVPNHVLRFWETKFSQIRPTKRGGGRRYYRPEDIELLSRIKTLLYDEGMTIKGVQKLFREQGVKTVVSGEAGVATVTTQSQPEQAGPVQADVAKAPADVGNLLAELRAVKAIADRALNAAAG